MKKIRRFAMITASVAIAAVLFFLPTLLCLQPVVRYALVLLNKQLAGSLEVQSCSLGWWQGLSCEDLRFQERALGLRVVAPRITGDKGLFVLLLAPQYLGEIHIDQPTLTFLPNPAGGDTMRPDAALAATAGRQAMSAAEQEAASRTRWWERLTFRFLINKGLVELDQGQGPKQELARDIDLQGSLAEGAVKYTLAFRSGLEQEGHLWAEGFINFPTARQSLLDTLVSKTEVVIKGLDISAFLDLAASRGDFPKGQGVLDASYHVVTAGLEHLEVSGETRLQALRLAGGFLGPDQPTVDHLLFTFKGSHGGKEGWQLATLKLESDPVRIEANGSYDRATASLAATGTVNLPVLAAQLPHLLSLHEKTTYREGLVDFSLNVSGRPQELELKAGCQTGRLAVVHNGQAFSWDTPLSLLAEASHRQGKTSFRTLQAHTPFLDMKGKGGADDFTLRATADLDRMFEELEKLFAFNFHGKGKMEATGSSIMQGDGRYRLDTRIGINGLALSRGGISLFPTHDFLLTGEAWTPPSFFQYGSFTSLRLVVDSWLGKLSLFVQNSARENGKMQTSCATNGVIDLERISRFFHGLAGVVPPLKVGGTFSFDGTGGWGGDRLTLEALEGKIDQLTVVGKGYAHQEPQVTVSLTNKALPGVHPVKVRELKLADNWQDFIEKERPGLVVDFYRQRLNLRHLTLEASGTSGRGNVSLGNWRQPYRDFAVEVTGESDAALLTPLCKALGWFPEDVAMKGRAQATVNAEASGEQGMLAEIVVQVEPFELLRAKKKLFNDPRLRLKAIVQGDLGAKGALKIPAFMLQVAPLQVEGTGSVQGKPLFLELQGTLTPDLTYFSHLLASALGQKIVLTGKREGVFQLASPFKLPVDMGQMTLSARLPVDSLQYQGVTLRQLELPIEMQRGMLRAVIAGEINGGRVAVQPQWTFGADRPELSVSSPSQVMKDVPLQQALLDGILVKMHPLFGVLAKPEGTIDLRLDGFSSPLVAKGAQWPVFNATIGLGKIQLKATKVLQDLLGLAGIDHGSLQLKERELTCAGKAGRITCTSLHLLAGDIEIEMSGTVGMDRTLACLVTLPLTERLAAIVNLPMQQGVAVKAEIGGALEAPFFDPEAFLATVTAQLGKAAAVKESELKPEEQPIQD